MLQYEIDTHATDLARRYDQASALLAYQSCLGAISELGAVAHAVGDVDFAKCKSLYYGLTAPGAILSSVAARVDPFRLASRLLRRMQRQGTRVFDRTHVKAVTATTRSVQLTTDSGMSIKARHAVIASGYEAQCWLRQRVAQNRSSYAYITDPVDRVELGWMASTLLWESARPYLYLRSTGDGRLGAALLRAQIDRRPHPLTGLLSFAGL